MRLIERLVKLGHSVEADLPQLNSGGCCVYAAMVGRRLHRLGVPVWGVVASPYAVGNVAEVRLNWPKGLDPKDPENWFDQGIGMGHVLLRFVWGGKVWTHDSSHTLSVVERTERNFNYQISEGGFTVAELQAFSNAGGWNKRFDREEGIPRIAEGIKTHLSKRALMGGP